MHGCDDNTDCDDEIDCTTDTCNGSQVCVHEPDDSVCDASGDVCNPNQCVPGEGCVPVDATETVSILANGNFDESAVIWDQQSTQFTNWSSLMASMGPSQPSLPRTLRG